MSRSWFVVVATITLVGSLAARASAQWTPQPEPNPWAQPQQTYPNAPPPPQAPPPQTYPPPQAYPPSQPYPPPQSYPPPQAYPQYSQQPFVQQPPREPRFRFYGTMGIGVPIFLSQDIQLYRPGANLRFEGGLDFGYIAPFFDLGFRWTPIDFDRWAANGGPPSYAGYGRWPLRSFYFGVGTRIQIPNLGRVLPYLSGAFDMNFWNFDETAVVCSGFYWWCYGVAVYTFTPGFTGRAGMAVKVTNHFLIDFGLGLAMSFQGNFFDQNQKWLEPHITFTHRR